MQANCGAALPAMPPRRQTSAGGAKPTPDHQPTKSGAAAPKEPTSASAGLQKAQLQGGEDPYVRQCLGMLAGSDASKGFAESLASIPQRKAARGDLVLIDAVLQHCDSKLPGVREAAAACVRALMVRNNETLASGMMRICAEAGTKRQRVVSLGALACCCEAIPQLSSELEAEHEQYRNLVASAPAKRQRIVEIKRAQFKMQQMRAEQGLEDDDNDEAKAKKHKRGATLRQKLKGRQQNEGVRLETELEELEQQMFSLDSGSFEHKLRFMTDEWAKLRESRINFNQKVVQALLRAVGDDDEGVRLAAMGALSSVAARGDTAVLSTAIAYLQKSQVPHAEALDAIGKSAPVGHKEALEMAVAYLSAPGDSGEAALEAFRQIVPRGDMTSLQGVVAMIATAPSGRILHRLSAAMLIVADPGDEFAIAMARQLLTHASREVRAIAVKTLILLCRPDNGDDRAIPSLRLCLQGDLDEIVRLEALKALSMCLMPSDMLTLRALAECVTDTSALIRGQAPGILARWAFMSVFSDLGSNDPNAIEKTAALASDAVPAKASVQIGAPATENKVMTSKSGTHKKSSDGTAQAEKAANQRAASERECFFAAASADLEREQYRDTVLKSVTKSLMTNLASSDSPVRSAALQSLGLLCSSGSVDGSILSYGLVSGMTEADEGKLEGILLLCNAHDLKQLVGASSVAWMSGIVKSCLASFNDLVQDLIKTATVRGTYHPSGRSEDVFGCNSRGSVVDQLRDVFLQRLVPILNGENKIDGNAQHLEPEAKAGRRWAAVLALRRCALQVLGQHIRGSCSDKDILATQRESEKLNWAESKRAPDANGQMGQHGGMTSGGFDGGHTGVHLGQEDPPTRAVHHPIFDVEGIGDKLKSAVFPTLLKMIENEENPTVRASAMRLILDLCPGGGNVPVNVLSGGKTVRQSVNGMIVYKLSKFQSSGDFGDIAGHEGHLKQECGGVAYLELLGNLWSLDQGTVCASPTESAALQQRNMQVIKTLKLLLQNSRAPRKVHMLAVRALGLIAACHPSVEIVKAVAEKLATETCTHDLVVILASLLRMDHVEVWEGWEESLHVVAGFLQHRDAGVRHLAAQLLERQIQHNNHPYQEVLLRALEASIKNNGSYSSSARTLGLRILQRALDADIIRPTAKMVQAVVQASYDDDMTVRTRALELLQHRLTVACPVDQEADKECTLEQAENSNKSSLFSSAGKEESPVDRVATDVDCNPQFLLVDGEPTRRSDLIREPTIANEANVRNWISTLKAMETFDQNSVLRVMEKVSGDQHWSVRQAALEYLTDVLQVAPPAPIASGLKWQIIITTTVPEGRELINGKLSAALKRTVVFEKNEWASFGIVGLGMDHFIKSGNSYYKPAAPLSEEQPLDSKPSSPSRPASEASLLEESKLNLGAYDQPFGSENEQEAARAAIECLKSDDVGVRNTAVALLAALLPSGHGARDELLKGDTVQDLLENPRTRPLCFKAFANDQQMLDECRQTFINASGSDTASVRRFATASMQAFGMNCTRSDSPIQILFAASRDADVSVRDAALDSWNRQDFRSCDQKWRDDAIKLLLRYASHPREVGESRAVVVRAIPAIAVKPVLDFHPTIEGVLALLEDFNVDVRNAAAEVVLQLASATEEVVGYLIGLVNRPENLWTRRDGAMMEIKAMAFWVLSRIEPQFSKISDPTRMGGNNKVVDFLWGNAAAEQTLIEKHKLAVWIKETLATGDSILTKVFKSIQEGRWEDARSDANLAMNEYLIAKNTSKSAHPEILDRILNMDRIFSDIANFRGARVAKRKHEIDVKLRAIHDAWESTVDLSAVDREGWNRLHYLSRWDMPDVIKTMVDDGYDINTPVAFGAWKGQTPYDLAKTESLRKYIGKLGGHPSMVKPPEYNQDRPIVTKPKIEVKARQFTKEQMEEINHDARSQITFKYASLVLDGPQPTAWTPRTQDGKKVSASARVASERCERDGKLDFRGSVRHPSHHALHFLDTIP